MISLKASREPFEIELAVMNVSDLVKQDPTKCTKE